MSMTVFGTTVVHPNQDLKTVFSIQGSYIGALCSGALSQLMLRAAQLVAGQILTARDTEFLSAVIETVHSVRSGDVLEIIARPVQANHAVTHVEVCVRIARGIAGGQCVCQAGLFLFASAEDRDARKTFEMAA